MKYTKELLEEAVSHSKTWADVCRYLGVKPNTGAQSHITNKSRKLGIDSSHFLGKSFIRGRVSSSRKDAITLCFKGSNIKSHPLKRRLIRDGYKKETCEICNLSEWNGEPIVLELDHKDSDNTNNDINNLQILCPNCHALETRKRVRAQVAQRKEAEVLEA